MLPMVPGMRPKEEPLAGYLMARAALHRKIEGAVLENLRAGHATVQEVSDLLPLGRANVKEDLEKAKSERPLQRHRVSRLLRGPMEEMNGYRRGTLRGDEYARMTAALSQYAKTGVCFSYATNTTALHGAKLAGMEDERAIVAEARDAEYDHVWSEMIPRGKGENGKPLLHGEDVIMDGWCVNNVAILREDSAFAKLDARGRGRHLSHDHMLDHRSGPEALASVNRYKAQIEGSRDLQEIFHRNLMGVVAAEAKMPEEGIWDATSVFHEDFREQASAALHEDAEKPGKASVIPPGADPVARQAKQASLAEIQAIGVARSLGADIRGAKAEAPAILAAAQEMFPRPEPENETVFSRLSAYLWG